MRKFILSLFAGALLASAQPAAKETLPTAESILDRYVEVTGGKAAYEKVKSSVSSGTMEIPAQNISGKMTIYAAAPDKQYVVTEIGSVGKIEAGSNGEVFWEKSSMQGPRIRKGAEADLYRRGATFNAPLFWRKLYQKVETTGTDTVDGKTCYKVALTPNGSSKADHSCYDKESGLLVRANMTMTSPMGELEIESRFSDYRKNGEVLGPHVITQHFGGQMIQIKIDKVELNADIPPEKFSMPDDVKALITPPAK
jgi:outer membrane lipoprotein-sorting protein